jgi:hypothetical protein
MSCMSYVGCNQLTDLVSLTHLVEAFQSK